MINANRGVKSAKYIIQVKSHLDSHWENWFDGMTMTHTGDGETILSGYVVDQSALHGLLEKIRNLNLILVSVRKADTDEENGAVREQVG